MAVICQHVFKGVQQVVVIPRQRLGWVVWSPSDSHSKPVKGRLLSSLLSVSHRHVVPMHCAVQWVHPVFKIPVISRKWIKKTGKLYLRYSEGVHEAVLTVETIHTNKLVTIHSLDIWQPLTTEPLQGVADTLERVRKIGKIQDILVNYLDRCGDLFIEPVHGSSVGQTWNIQGQKTGNLVGRQFGEILSQLKKYEL